MSSFTGTLPDTAAYAGITAQVLSGSQRSWLGWGMPGTVLFGGVGSAINDALNRVAAIPMGLKALVGLLVLGVVSLFAFGMSQGSNTRRHCTEPPQLRVSCMLRS